jgi:hypothetical protein
MKMINRSTNSLTPSGRSVLLFIPVLIGCCVILPITQAVIPAPDGGYANANTAEGQNALFNISNIPNVRFGNTAVSWQALFTNDLGSYNTAVGAGALLLSREANENTAVGAAALLLNDGGVLNTAVGNVALSHNTFGSWNSATGAYALYDNVSGSANCAFGYQALYSNDSTPPYGVGQGNNAFGLNSLVRNVDGFDNDAFGTFALEHNVNGLFNNAFGYGAFGDIVDGTGNTAIGDSAGAGNRYGDFNTYVGVLSTTVPSTESDTIRIGDPAFGIACYVGGIFGQTVDPGTGVAVVVDGDGKLGTIVSSKRFKEEIRPMDSASEVILDLKPVSFRYKIDGTGTPQYGLIAEEVAKVAPDLVVRDKNREIYTVRYDAVNAMLLNEFLKEHRKVERLKKEFAAKLAEQQRRIEVLTSGLEKVNAQLEASDLAKQVSLKAQ